MRDFLLKSSQANKTKLILDLRGNSGGNAILGYDTFKQLFPQAIHEPFGGTRIRVHEALHTVGNTTHEFAAGRTFAQGNQTAFAENFDGTTPNDILLFTSPFNFEHQLDVDQQGFGSWEAMTGPQQLNGDEFSNLMRYNLSDVMSYGCPEFSVTGFLDNTNGTSEVQPFGAENIVMVCLKHHFFLTHAYFYYACLWHTKLTLWISFMMACVHQPARSSPKC